MDYSGLLTDFIKQEILHGRSVALNDDVDLLASGVIDSLGILRMVAFMEERFGVKVPDEDVVFENFQNIRVMAQYIAQQKSTAQA
jgi:acyl carrier protein